MDSDSEDFLSDDEDLIYPQQEESSDITGNKQWTFKRSKNKYLPYNDHLEKTMDVWFENLKNNFFPNLMDSDSFYQWIESLEVFVFLF